MGSSEDQWRPCSEKYYPYLPSPRPIRPSTGDRHDRPERPHDPGYYHGRHWPITYFHREPPPNCTDSLASADNSGRRRSNETTSTTIELPSSTTTVRSNENSTVTTTTIRSRLRRLRVREDRRERVSPRKILPGSSRIVVPKAAKIERVLKPTTKDEIANRTVRMIRMPVIAPNSSLSRSR